MLRAVATYHPKPISKAQIATLAGLSFKSGTFTTYLSKLRVRDLIVEESRNQYVITDEGMQEAGEFEPLPTDTESLVAMWESKPKVPLGAGRMLRKLVETYPNSMTKEELGESIEPAMSYTSGTFTTYLSVLRRNGLIKVDGQQITATEELFPK